MINRFKLLNFLLPALTLTLAGPAWAGQSFQATVLRVSDGDTIVVRTDGFEDIKVRLYGIDAPERDQEGGAEATEALRVILGQAVTITEMAVDRYGRTVALVEHEGRVVNLDLVAQGLAWYYGQYCKAQPICGEIKAAEAQARTAARRLWAGAPMAPWDWRRSKRTG